MTVKCCTGGAARSADRLSKWRRFRLESALILSSGLAALSSSYALAQTAASQAPAAAANQAAPNELEEIIVTAEKRSENIQQAPAAITSVSGDLLTAVGAVNISDMSALFPSSRFEYAFGFPHLYVRGIGSEQDRITVDQLVNVFIDGVLLPREMGAIGQSDLNAIELLPGPQGTLYGASSVGGVLNVRNNRPTQTDDLGILAEYGNFDSLHLRGTENWSVNDELALRGSVDYISHDPYETTGRWTANTLTARVSALYNPSDNFSA
jgi:iron complex outermembrane receptor protein